MLADRVRIIVAALHPPKKNPPASLADLFNMKKEPVYLSQKIKGVYKVDAGVLAEL